MATGLPIRTWRCFMLFGAAAVALRDVVPSADLSNALYVLVGVATVTAIVVGVRRNRPTHARVWWCFGAGLSSWVVGDALTSFPGYDISAAADLCYLAGYPMVAMGLFALGRARVSRHDRTGVIDAWIVTTILSLVLYELIAQPLLERPSSGVLSTALQLGYPLGDILLVAGLVRVLATPGTQGASARLLTAALALMLVADLASLTLELYADSAPGWLEHVWLASYLCWAAAALHPGMVVVTVRGPRRGVTTLGRGMLVVAGLAASAPLAVLAGQELLGSAQIWSAVVGSTVLIALVLSRLRLAAVEITEVSRQSVELQDQLAFEATHDALTLLANRSHGLKLLQQALDRSGTEGAVTVMFLDLDGFKQVNDTLGHRAGDQLLRRVAERLSRSTRDDDVAIRLGGDEFVLVLETVPDAESALQVADRVIEAVSRPVLLGPQGTARVGVSVGISQCFDGSAEAATLLNEADVAAYRAKRSGKGRAELFDLALREALVAQERRAAELRRAIDRDELVLHYQPVIDSMSGAVRGYEALVRWDHAVRGRLMPADFLPVAESADLICDLDRWVLHRATAQLQQWVTESGFDHLVMAVNISTTTAARTRLVDDVRDALHASGLRPDRLVLELPERVLGDLDRTVVHLRRVQALGVSISIADFGAGVSALATLSQLPVNVVKIGRSSLDLTTPMGDNLLKLMIQGAHAVGLNAVAEGVERDDQLATLRSLDCEMVQGFHLARPMPAEDVVAYHLEQAVDRFSGLRP